MDHLNYQRINLSPPNLSGITYKDSGINLDLGELCSKIAYAYAKKTFKNRNKIGKAVNLEGGFSGLIDFGDFYLCFNSDGIGSKVLIGKLLNQYYTLGYDLVSMVADDAVTLGAEPVSLVNTLDLEKVDPIVVESLMHGLEKAARWSKIIVSGGEIAELPSIIHGLSWSASLIGILEKNKLIDGSKIKAGDQVVALLTDNLRSNGFSLARKILFDYYGKHWYKIEYGEGISWGEKLLEPSFIFTPFILKLIGKFKEKSKIKINGIAHITGGGVYNNLERIIPKNLKVNYQKLPSAPLVFKRIQDLGKIPDKEAYRVWNMGIGMVLVSPEVNKIIKLASQNKIKAQIIGIVEEQ
ncbi:MAG: phosphoribosylformylglycinamidine cyclo-ligase [Armatimonadetes bacterium]|nr:phosphoribosylformylglycinamidine cyclo-ligase [Armatimonadota bacterium]